MIIKQVYKIFSFKNNKSFLYYLVRDILDKKTIIAIISRIGNN